MRVGPHRACWYVNEKPEVFKVCAWGGGGVTLCLLFSKLRVIPGPVEVEVVSLTAAAVSGVIRAFGGSVSDAQVKKYKANHEVLFPWRFVRAGRGAEPSPAQVPVIYSKNVNLDSFSSPNVALVRLPCCLHRAFKPSYRDHVSPAAVSSAHIRVHQRCCMMTSATYRGLAAFLLCCSASCTPLHEGEGPPEK